jgi:protein-tyrosine phosphatase
VLSWFKRKETAPTTRLQVDIHSHLLPGLDDGVKTVEEALAIITAFQKLGYKKLYTTPHIMADAFPNSSQNIITQLDNLNTYLKSREVEMEVHAAAEYYLDESLIENLKNNVPLLAIGNRYLLFETNFISEPLNLKEFIFLATTKGYQLILAHPERYLYLQNRMDKIEDLFNRGVLFQLNISSLTAYYSKAAQYTAQKMIDRGWVHWLGSDCHHKVHIEILHEARKTKYFQKALTLPLLNNTL